MMRWIGVLLVMGCWTIMGWFPAEASDHSIAKSLTHSGTSVPVRHARACVGEDLQGNWELIRFDSSYRFKNQRAPYLYPYQVFQYSNEGGAKSLHSLRPIVGQSKSLFSPVPLEMMYQVKKSGRVFLKTRGRDAPVETWICEVVTQGYPISEEGNARERGDLIMTLIGSGGQPLFVRHLRKRAA
jgi:hypothetical protein